LLFLNARAAAPVMYGAAVGVLPSEFRASYACCEIFTSVSR